MKQHTALVIVSLCTIAMSATGCKKKDADPPPSFAPAVPTTTATTQPTAQPTTTATGPVAPTPVDPALAHIISAQLVPIVSRDAKGMQPSGEMLAGNLQQGQYLEQTVSFQPGKCYTVVGMGMPGIQELDITMSPSIPLPNAPTIPFAQDNMTGAQATVAPQPNCHKYIGILPLQVKITVTAKAGSGPVGAQLYVK